MLNMTMSCLINRNILNIFLSDKLSRSFTLNYGMFEELKYQRNHGIRLSFTLFKPWELIFHDMLIRVYKYGTYFTFILIAGRSFSSLLIASLATSFDTEFPYLKEIQPQILQMGSMPSKCRTIFWYTQKCFFFLRGIYFNAVIPSSNIFLYLLTHNTISQRPRWIEPGLKLFLNECQDILLPSNILSCQISNIYPRDFMAGMTLRLLVHLFQMSPINRG